MPPSSGRFGSIYQRHDPAYGLRRNHISLRDIRCDLFSVESLAAVLYVRKSEVIAWIERAWLPATITERGKRRFYTITPEALKNLYKHHHRNLMQRGMRNLALFEAYLEHCFDPNIPSESNSMYAETRRESGIRYDWRHGA